MHGHVFSPIVLCILHVCGVPVNAFQIKGRRKANATSPTRDNAGRIGLDNLMMLCAYFYAVATRTFIDVKFRLAANMIGDGIRMASMGKKTKDINHNIFPLVSMCLDWFVKIDWRDKMGNFVLTSSFKKIGFIFDGKRNIKVEFI